MAFEATDILMCMHNHDAADARGDAAAAMHVRKKQTECARVHIRTRSHTPANTQQGCRQRVDVNSRMSAKFIRHICRQSHTHTQTNRNGDRVCVTMATAKPKGSLLKRS